MELKVEDLNISLGGKKIINNVNLHIKNKEFVGIIGPNGSGKSTLLKMIYRVLKPDSGNIFINGREIRMMSLKETAKEMAVVSQHNEQNFDFKVLDMVLIGRSPHKNFLERNNKEDYDIVIDALEKVDMIEFKDRDFKTLSGGEKQRIILARALAQDTNCLILDEPTNHLDIKYQFQFMNIAKKLDITIITAVHDLNMASLYCDKIYALKEGKIIAKGTPEQVITENLIEDLYGVKSKIIKDEKHDFFNVVYRPF